MELVTVDDDLAQGVCPRDLREDGLSEWSEAVAGCAGLTFCLSSSVRASERTLAHGKSFGHQTGRVDSFPQPGFPLPVEYFSIRGMNARSCA